MKWRPDNQDPGGVWRSDPERFVIVLRPCAEFNYWLTDLAGNAPPNPPLGFKTRRQAEGYAGRLGVRPAPAADKTGRPIT